MLETLLADVGTSGWNTSLVLLLVKATIILLAALGITMAMQRASAGARHLVWLVTLGTLLLVPALTAWGPLQLGILPAATAPKSADPVVNATPAPAPFAVQAQERSAAVESRIAGVAANDSAPVEATNSVVAFVKNMSALSLVVTVWFAVVLAIVASLAWASLMVRRIVRQSTALDTPDWLTPLWEVADRMGLQDVPRLLRSNDSKMPFACGLARPTIVLPAECDAWSLDRRRAVLLHELAHVRRHDLLGHTLGRLVCAIYWFHPLVWTAAKHLRSESERACDDLALSCGTRATDYAEHLLEIVTSVRRDSTPSVALAMARRKEFEGRMLAILDPELLHSSPSRRQSAVLIATLALISVTVGAASPVRREAVVGAQQVAAELELPVTQSDTSKDKPKAAPLQARIASDTHQFTSRSVSVMTSKSTSTSMQGNLQRDGFSTSIVEDAMRLGMRAGMSAAAQAIGSKEVTDAIATATSLSTSAIANARKGGTAVQSDERPALLAKVLRSDSSASLRKIAAWGLHEYADGTIASEALAHAVRRDSDAKVREMAAWSLGHSDRHNSTIIDALAGALRSDANEGVRAIAAWSLGNIGDRSSVDELVAGLGDASESVRRRAIWAIGNVGPNQAPRELVAKLRDSEPRVRKLAAWALFNIEDPSTVSALDAALKSEQDKDVQLALIRALAALGEKSVDALKGLLESSDPQVKGMAVRALAGGHGAGPWPWPWPEPRPFP